MEVSQRLIPVRCFQCGMPLNHLQEEYDARVLNNESDKDILAALNVTRLCCRVNLMQAPADPRLRRRLPPRTGFTDVKHEPFSTASYTLAMDNPSGEPTILFE